MLHTLPSTLSTEMSVFSRSTLVCGMLIRLEDEGEQRSRNGIDVDITENTLFMGFWPHCIHHTLCISYVKSTVYSLTTGPYTILSIGTCKPPTKIQILFPVNRYNRCWGFQMRYLSTPFKLFFYVRVSRDLITACYTFKSL